MSSGVDEGRLFKKIYWRIIPLLFAGFFIAFLDRINIGFVQLQMGTQLAIDPAAFGFAAGVFFLTYALFELPSNWVFVKFGPRKTFFRIMMLWGFTVIGTAFVETKNQLYLMRALLGFFEAGFLPGAILYLTYWFPSAQRARSTALFLSSVFVAATLVGPISGAMMSAMERWHGLHGWQWVFIAQGAPACIMALVFLFALPDSPSTAKWLSPQERSALAEILAKDSPPDPHVLSKSVQLKTLLSDRNLYLFVLVYFTGACANYYLNFWLPTILKSISAGSLMQVGALSAIPSAVGIAGLLLINWSSDRLKDRKWHLIGCYVVCGIGLLASVYFKGSLPGVIAAFSLANFALYAIGSLFWTLPATYFTRTTAVLGLSVVGGLSNTAGFVSPYVVGLMRTAFGNFDNAVYLIVAMFTLSVSILLFAIPRRAVRVGTGAQR